MTKYISVSMYFPIEGPIGTRAELLVIDWLFASRPNEPKVRRSARKLETTCSRHLLLEGAVEVSTTQRQCGPLGDQALIPVLSLCHLLRRDLFEGPHGVWVNVESNRVRLRRYVVGNLLMKGVFVRDAARFTSWPDGPRALTCAKCFKAA